MAMKITKHGVTITRENKLVHLRPGTAYDFTEKEIEDLMAGDAIRDPIREAPPELDPAADTGFQTATGSEPVTVQQTGTSKVPAADDL